MKIDDSRGSAVGAALIACAVVFATVGLPLALDGLAVPLAWAGESVVLAWLGYRLGYQHARTAGAVVVALAAYRVFPSGPGREDVGLLFANPGFACAIAIGGAAAIYALVHLRHRASASALDRKLAGGVAIGAGMYAAFVVFVELWNGLDARAYPCLARLVVVAPWLVAAVGFAVAGDHLASRRCRRAAIACLVITACAVAYALRVLAPQPPFALNARFAVAMFTVVVALRIARVIGRGEAALGRKVQAAALVGLGLAFSNELVGQLDASDAALWIARALWAIALVIVGLARHAREDRGAGLWLLGVTAAELAPVDLASDPLARLLLFAVAGLVMLGASVAYHRVRE